MIAPTEKHLEDWIVANPSRFALLDEIDGDQLLSPLLNKIIARQLRLPSGIADLVALTRYWEPSLAVIEIKRDAVNEKTVAQCLRYMHNIQDIYAHVLNEWEDISNENRYRRISMVHMRHMRLPEISGIVVGHSLANENIALVCEACGIIAVTYDFDGEQYEFSLEDVTTVSHSDRTEFAVGAIGDAIRSVMQGRLDGEKAAARRDAEFGGSEHWQNEIQ